MNKTLFLAVLAAATIVLSGCGKEDDVDNSILLTSSNQTLFYDDEFQIDATSSLPITYTSEDEYHAKVSASGLVTAGRVGETNIVLSNGKDTKKIKITVRPESNLYPEPELTFGMTRAAVKSKLGTPDSETDAGMGWTNYSTNAPILMCLFDEADKLESYSVMVKTAYSSELGTFLGERYVPFSIDEENYTILCVNGLTLDTATMLIGASVYNSSYWMVTYIPYTQSRSIGTVDYSEIMKSIDELMNK